MKAWALMATFATAVAVFGSSVVAETKATEFWSYAPTPPMGWNSWDCWGTGVTEAQYKANADFMADRLLKFGWQYVVVDIQWYEPAAKTLQYRKDAKLILDANGRLLPATNRFPSSANGAGFKPLAEYAHSKGLKFGIHLLRGIPRQAVAENLPILGSDAHAKDIANTHDTCAWNPDMYGIDMSKPGAQEYYDSVFKLIASWDVDFVKVDDLSRPYGPHQPEIEAIRKAIDNAGRPMVLSTSPGETPLDAAEHVAKHANMWRISDDFWDEWPPLVKQFERCANWAQYSGPGHYPDADMIPFARVRAWQPKDKGGWTRFTHDEQQTLMSLWAIAQSPLMFGGHLPETDAFTLSLLTNAEVIKINQKGRQPHQVSRDGHRIVWMSEAADGGKNIALFNLGDKPEEVAVKLSDLGIQGSAGVHDCWPPANIGRVENEIRRTLPAHGSTLLVVK